MQAFETRELLEQQQAAGRRYLEFLRVPALSLGLYHLAAGGVDPQQPHTEAEAYYIVAGRGQIFVAGENRAVEPGSIIFVPAGVEHRFHSIIEALDILVFFAPAEGALAVKP